MRRMSEVGITPTGLRPGDICKCIYLGALPGRTSKYTPRPIKTLNKIHSYRVLLTKVMQGSQLVLVHCDTRYGGCKRWYAAERFKKA